MASLDLESGARWRPSAGQFQRRLLMNRVMFGLVSLAIGITVIPLILVLLWVTLQGLPALNLNFFTQVPGPPDDPNTGFANGIAGTAILLAIASAISVPIGVGAGIYLAEFGGSKFNTLIRFATDVLSGVPSITMGVFIYTVVVQQTHSFSAFAGGLALSLIMIPLIMRSTE